MAKRPDQNNLPPRKLGAAKLRKLLPPDEGTPEAVDLKRTQAELRAERRAVREAEKAQRKADREAKAAEAKAAKLEKTFGAADSAVIDPKQRANRLKALIEPKTEAMVKVMIDIAEDEKVHPSIRMECADRLLSRAYGKPKEHMVIEDPGDATTEVDEVRGLLNNILEKVGAPLLTEPKAGE